MIIMAKLRVSSRFKKENKTTENNSTRLKKKIWMNQPDQSMM